ncbi:hypothetical protein LTR36_000238 [Oleoguttula mirabilis]|uniref:Uncharacterized protein n=1 Tax=Oleoguttula mirabilis TaxID=1507867 RepID=A0AAV9JYC4_9PEZI|nr:hypothetical protein LTR36_000238 [Oleoguttula mirabilis]
MERANRNVNQQWDRITKSQGELIEQGKSLLVCDVQNMLATIKVDDGAYSLELDSFQELAKAR